MNTLGNRLKDLRKNKNLRQKDLAQALGLGQTTIANYEQGIRFPNEKVLKNFADYFNVSLDFLLGRMEINKIEEYEGKKNYIDNFITPSISSNKRSFFSTITRDYIKFLLNGQKYNAMEVILSAVEKGTNIKDIYSYILYPSLQEIGLLWQRNEINIAKEHYFSQSTKDIMNLLYPYIICKNKKNYSIVAVAAGGELHDIGLKMVTDFFEMTGWNTYYLGVNTPSQSIIHAIELINADILAISATMPYHINAVENIIHMVHSSNLNKKVKIMVGGNAFNLENSLWQVIGADGYSSSADEAVKLAENLLDIK